MGQLEKVINDTFGDYEVLRNQMTTTAMNQFGSGWAWLSCKKDGGLVVHATPNQDSPLSEDLTPLLTIDVWEHAYYLKYMNKRDEFVQNFWNLINWSVVEKRFLARS